MKAMEASEATIAIYIARVDAADGFRMKVVGENWLIPAADSVSVEAAA